MMRKSTLMICLLILVPVGISYGQNFDSMYGAGIHKFFSGCNAEAIQLFDAAIAAKPNDPRPYYYRGLAKMNYGDQFAAQADYRLGAQMEALGKRRSSLVSRSLERIQGNNRLCIEQARQNALNPSLQTARNGYGASPNVVYGQQQTYPPIAPTALPPSTNPSQAIIQAPTDNSIIPAEVQPSPSGVAAESTEIAAPDDLLTTPESTTTSLPAAPETSNAVTPADATPAVESGLETPMATDGTTTEARALNPTGESSDADPLQAAEPKSAQTDAPFGTEPAAEASVPESKPAPAIDEPIEFPSEPTDEAPFGDVPLEESDMPAEDSAADELHAEDVPVEDESTEPQDSSDELPADESVEEDSADEESGANDNPFGG
ncbi:hypothetical protein N9231_05270 [Saprospiraceae bacterium]|nr:hypothetical protein [Saprospiraceae bacterium]